MGVEEGVFVGWHQRTPKIAPVVNVQYVTTGYIKEAI